MRALGIDPGLAATGFGVIELVGNIFTPLDWGVIRSNGTDLAARLEHIYRGLLEIIDSYRPEKIAVEDIFTGRNPRSALLMGHARGAALLAAAHGSEVVEEYAARSIKQAITGHGGATKEQVAYMVRRLLNLDDRKVSIDASDALAVAACCLLKSGAKVRL